MDSQTQADRQMGREAVYIALGFVKRLLGVRWTPDTLETSETNSITSTFTSAS